MMTQFGLRHQIMNDKMSLNLNVRDPFNLARSRFETRDETHVQVGRTTPSLRSLVLSLSYSFGRPPRNARQRDSEDPAEQEAEAEQVIR